MSTSSLNQLNRLLADRYHGAVNIAGIRFQLMYSLLKAFDLYKPNAPVYVRLEGIDDIDIKQHRQVELKGIKISNQCIQVKTSKKGWDWGRFASSKILQNFMPVWQADHEAELLLVSNFGYEGILDELVKFCQGKRNNISNKLKKDLLTLFKREKYTAIDQLQFLRHINFMHISEEELIKQSFEAVTRYFELDAPNPELYFLALMSKMLDWAVKRYEITKPELETVRLFIQEQINMGVVNPAILNGWLERLSFTNEDHPEDYYEGKNARPGHIAANLDVRRPVWEKSISEALQRSRICIIRASSGQGKSTLLYRYAHEHYNPETTFIVKLLSNEDMIGSIKQVIASRRRLNLPILILIDNLRTGLRYWQKLAAEFAGQEVFFLITVREEDWFRYQGNTSGLIWETVSPKLSLDEAKSIYADFKKEGKVANDVISAAWAYEKISERKLLLEYTYLVTHGQMLEERLRDQLQEIQHLGEDTAKLEVLRLVAIADVYGARVPIQALLNSVQFQQDPDQTLSSLRDEYLLFTNGMCEGLHIVRSQHLVSLLHDVIPKEDIIVKLIHLLDFDNLDIFIGNTFVDIGINHTPLLQNLKERCRSESLVEINRLVMGLFTASEILYYRKNQILFDAAFEQIGRSGIFLLCSKTLPFQTVDVINNLKEIFPDSPNLELIASLAAQSIPRQRINRFESQFLTDIMEGITSDKLQTGFDQIGTFMGWCQFAEVNPSRIVTFLEERNWQEEIYTAKLDSAANLLIALHDYAREKYDQLMVTDKPRLLSYFKLASDTLLIEERNDDIYIEFTVDKGGDSSKHHEETITRLRKLREFFPDYQHYCSLGLYPSIYDLRPPVDNTIKAIPNDTLKLEIHADKNAAYIKAIESYYSSQSVYEWQEQWYTLRLKFIESIEMCIDVYRKSLQGRKANIKKLNMMFIDSLTQAVRLRDLSFPWKYSFDKDLEAINSWETSVNNFLRQYLEHDPKDAQQSSSRLMRYNLKEAAKNLPRMQQSYQIISNATQLYFNLSDLNVKEGKNYSFLAEILDLWFQRPFAQIPNVNKVIAEQRDSRKKEFIDAVHEILAPLEKSGFKFVYPTQPVLDHPLIQLYLAFEVTDFECFIEDLLSVITRLATFPLECHFANLIPLLNGKRYLSHVLRISFDTIRKIVEDRVDNPFWSILPVEPTLNLNDVLPKLGEMSLYEDKLQVEFYRIYGVMNTARNLAYLIKSRLDRSKPFEEQLYNRYWQAIDTDLKSIPPDIVKLKEQMRAVETDNNTTDEWQNFCDACMNRLQTISDIETLQPDTFQPIKILQDLEILILFNRYLNAKYIKLSEGTIRAAPTHFTETSAS